MKSFRPKRDRRQKGHAIVETVLMAPWVFLLFLGIFDVGFYAYAVISTANAARVAALATSSSDTSAADAGLACGYALPELRALPNIGTAITTCGALPLIVTATSVVGPDGDPASKVSVTYQSIQLFPIPGLMGQLQVTRSATMRVKSS
jgi:hypothetical protein